MPDSITVDFDENFQASLTLGNGDGNLNLADLHPCGNFQFEVVAEGDSNLIVRTRGEIPVIYFRKDVGGHLSFLKTLDLHRSQTIPGNDPNLVLGIVALTSDKTTPIVVCFNLFRDDRRLTFNFL